MTVDQKIGTLQNAFTTGNSITVSNLVSGVAANDVISLDGAFTATVNGVAGAVLTLSQGVQAPVVFPVGMPIMRLTCVTYSVTGIGVTPPFQLLRAVGAGAGVAVLGGLEAISFAYAVDSDAHRQIDDQ